MTVSVRRAALTGLLPGLILSAGAAFSAAAADRPPSWHFFSGADVAHRSAFTHGGFVWSPQGHLHEPGWRLRGLGSGGAYRYRAQRFNVLGRSLVAELTPGYAWMWDGRGIELYFGATVEDHATRPHDPGKPRQGTRVGAKALFEAWKRLSDDLIVEASAGYATAARSYAVRVAASLAVAGRFGIEPEIAAFGEPGYDQLRLGLHAELYRTPRARVLVGGGWSFDRDGSGAYVGLRAKSWR